MGQTDRVAVVKYEGPVESSRRAVDLSGGLDRLKPGDKVFIKPNIVFFAAAPFPKWGVITTSRIVEDMVVLLKERGIDDLTLGEGMVSLKPKDPAMYESAFETLGYKKLEARYGLKLINVYTRPFKEIDFGDGAALSFNQDALESDFIVDLPVLKTHAQTGVSLGIKNLKGLIDIESRKRCHAADTERDLHWWVAHLAEAMPPIFTLIDGIYSNERGPSFDGKPRRSDMLVASADVLSADLVGSALLGHRPDTVPHLGHAARLRGRTPTLDGVDVVGESIEDLASYHQSEFPYNEEGTLPGPMAKMGVEGLSYYKYDTSMCTYCSAVNWLVLSAIAMAWKGEPFDRVEVLTGKRMRATPGKKTVLLGKCMWDAHKDHPDVDRMIAIKGCPPMPSTINQALHQAGIMVDPAVLESWAQAPGYFMKRYGDRPEFEESFFRVD
jgi:uncharacterized protein (DUF362 family)